MVIAPGRCFGWLRQHVRPNSDGTRPRRCLSTEKNQNKLCCDSMGLLPLSQGKIGAENEESETDRHTRDTLECSTKRSFEIRRTWGVRPMSLTGYAIIRENSDMRAGFFRASLIKDRIGPHRPQGLT